MEKIEHLALMLNRRTAGKKYENFVINAIYARIANPNLIPITQQYVKNKHCSKSNPRKYYLLDLYFPQLNYGIEVDEGHHLNKKNVDQDKNRAEDILASIQCDEGRITIYNKDGSLKTFDEVNEQINVEVEKVKGLIKKKGRKLAWLDNDARKNAVIQRGYFKIDDEVDYKGITEIYNIVGHDVKNLGQGFVKLNDSYKLWGPYLAYQLGDETLITKNGWENTLSEDKSIIYEIPKDVDDPDPKEVPDGSWKENNVKRVVFMHIRDNFGCDKMRFLGVYAAFRIETRTDGKRKRIYKRIAESVGIAELKP